jgi:uncharacterized protein
MLNIIVTNKCNLSCTYCYEQHSKDSGVWDLPKLTNALNFLINTNDNNSRKKFQFFGGEPLMQKQLILDFIETHHEYVYNNNIDVSIVTNFLLADKVFLDRFFANHSMASRRSILVSLDDYTSDKDFRKLTDNQISYIFNLFDYCKQKGYSKYLSIRSTLPKENLPHLREFIRKLHEDYGINSLVIHPLILSNADGYIEWSNEEWAELSTIIDETTNKYKSLYFEFAEGVGTKSSNSCIHNMDTLSVTADGDISGCYFFSNHKDDDFGRDYQVGNIFSGVNQVEKTAKYDDLFQEMQRTDPLCQTCDVKDRCYQCPAGNLASFGVLFKPNEMCKKIVQLYDLIETKKETNMIFNDYLEATQAVEGNSTAIKVQIVEYASLFSINKPWMKLMFYVDVCDYSDVPSIDMIKSMSIDEVLNFASYCIVNKVFDLSLLTIIPSGQINIMNAIIPNYRNSAVDSTINTVFALNSFSRLLSK